MINSYYCGACKTMVPGYHQCVAVYQLQPSPSRELYLLELKRLENRIDELEIKLQLLLDEKSSKDWDDERD